MQKPRKLEPGSRIAVVAPSFSAEPSVPFKAEQALLDMGLLPVLFPSCFASWGYFSGTDALRASDINRAFSDPSIDGIFCLRGGYGASRLLPLLDYTSIRRHPKVFLGYSDITALHLVFQDRCRLVTFHGPMAGSLASAAPDSISSLLRNICCDHPIGQVQNPGNTPLYTLTSRSPASTSTEGLLTGGNLTTLCSLVGTPYEPDIRGKILFLEDVGEAPYRIDRMLTTLLLSGKLCNCAGIILGTFTDCPADSRPLYRRFSLEEIFRNRLLPARVPVLCGLRAGHTDPQLTLPFGTRVRLNTDSPALYQLETGVTGSDG